MSSAILAQSEGEKQELSRSGSSSYGRRAEPPIEDAKLDDTRRDVETNQPPRHQRDSRSTGYGNGCGYIVVLRYSISWLR